MSTRARDALAVGFILGAASLVLHGCHPGASEPAPHSVATDAGATALHHETHRIIDGDHRHVVELRVDDRIVLPVDPTFDWRVDFEDRSAFARFTEADAGREAYRVTKAGPYRIMVYGDPKCLKGDAGCTISKRRWDVTLDVR